MLHKYHTQIKPILFLEVSANVIEGIVVDIVVVVEIGGVVVVDVVVVW